MEYDRHTSLECFLAVVFLPASFAFCFSKNCFCLQYKSINHKNEDSIELCCCLCGHTHDQCAVK